MGKKEREAHSDHNFPLLPLVSTLCVDPLTLHLRRREQGRRLLRRALVPFGCLHAAAAAATAERL